MGGLIQALAGILGTLGKFTSRKFLLSTGFTIAAMVLASAAPELIRAASPFLWAAFGIVVFYVVVEGVPDAIERVIFALVARKRAELEERLLDEVISGKVPPERLAEMLKAIGGEE